MIICYRIYNLIFVFDKNSSKNKNIYINNWQINFSFTCSVFASKTFEKIKPVFHFKRIYFIVTQHFTLSPTLQAFILELVIINLHYIGIDTTMCNAIKQICTQSLPFRNIKHFLC